MSKSGDVILGAVEKCGDYLGATPMTYAEAAKRATEIWFERLKDPALPLLCADDLEALAVLRRAEGVMEAVEGSKHLSDCAERVEFLVTKFKHGYEGAPEELAILRAALKCREEK